MRERTHEPLRLTEEDALQRIADDPGAQRIENGVAYILVFGSITVAIIATLIMVALISGGWLP